MIPIIATTQADITDIVKLEEVEIKGAEFPLTRDEITEKIKDTSISSVVTSRDYFKHAWCVFEATAELIEIERLVVKNADDIDLVLSHMFQTITFTVGQMGRPLVRTRVPEYDTDHYLYGALMEQEFDFKGLDPDFYNRYAQKFDAIILEKQF